MQWHIFLKSIHITQHIWLTSEESEKYGAVVGMLVVFLCYLCTLSSLFGLWIPLNNTRVRAFLLAPGMRRQSPREASLYNYLVRIVLVVYALS